MIWQLVHTMRSEKFTTRMSIFECQGCSFVNQHLLDTETVILYPGWGGSSTPPYSTINYLLEVADMSWTMKKRKNLGCNYGPRMMVVVLVVLILCWGEWSTNYQLYEDGESSSKYNNQLNSTMTRIFSNEEGWLGRRKFWVWQQQGQGQFYEDGK